MNTAIEQKINEIGKILESKRDRTSIYPLAFLVIIVGFILYITNPTFVQVKEDGTRSNVKVVCWSLVISFILGVVILILQGHQRL